MEFLDAATLATRSQGGETRLWSVGGDRVEEKEIEVQGLVFSKGIGREKRLGDHIITGENEPVRVQRVDGGDTGALFLAPGRIKALDCAGDKIAVGCERGEVLHLGAAYLA